MNIPSELRLLRTTIVDSHNKHTQSGMKTVLVLEAPMGKDTADLLGCGFLFNRSGAPIPDVKSFSIDGKLENVRVEFPVGENEVVEFTPEKLAAFTVKHVEDSGFFIGFRVHLVGKILEAASLHDRKADAEFHLIVRPLQKNLFEEADEKPKDDKKRKGKHPDLATSEASAPAEVSQSADGCSREYAKGKITARVTAEPVDAGFAAGWEAELKFRHKKAIHEPAGPDSPTFGSEISALLHGPSRLLEFVKKEREIPHSDGENAALDDFQAWLESMAVEPGA